MKKQILSEEFKRMQKLAGINEMPSAPSEPKHILFAHHKDLPIKSLTYIKFKNIKNPEQLIKELNQIAQISDPRSGFRFPEGDRSIKTFPPMSEPIYGYIFVDQIQLIGDKPFAFNNEYDKIKDIFDEIEWSPKPPSNFAL